MPSVAEGERAVSSPVSGLDDHRVRLLRRRFLGSSPSCGLTRVLAVDGRSGTGKTSLAQAVQRVCPPGTALVGLDELYPGWDGLAATPDLLVEWVFAPLSRDEPASYRRFDWQRNVFAEPVHLGRPRWLIVEGVSALARVCRPWIGLGVWLDGAHTFRFERAIGRDGDLFRPHWARWARHESHYLDTEQPSRAADLRWTLRE